MESPSFIYRVLWLLSLSVTVTNGQLQKNFTCPRTLTVTNARLHGGFSAGNFERLGLSSDNEQCIERCCERASCDLIANVGEHCYAVSCFSENLCRPVRLSDDERGSTLLYIVSRKDSLSDDPRNQISHPGVSRSRRSVVQHEPSSKIAEESGSNQIGSTKDNTGTESFKNVPMNPDEEVVSQPGFFSGDSDYTSGSAGGSSGSAGTLFKITLGKEGSSATVTLGEGGGIANMEGSGGSGITLRGGESGDVMSGSGGDLSRDVKGYSGSGSDVIPAVVSSGEGEEQIGDESTSGSGGSSADKKEAGARGETIWGFHKTTTNIASKGKAYNDKTNKLGRDKWMKDLAFKVSRYGNKGSLARLQLLLKHRSRENDNEGMIGAQGPSTPSLDNIVQGKGETAQLSAPVINLNNTVQGKGANNSSQLSDSALNQESSKKKERNLKDGRNDELLKQGIQNSVYGPLQQVFLKHEKAQSVNPVKPVGLFKPVNQANPAQQDDQFEIHGEQAGAVGKQGGRQAKPTSKEDMLNLANFVNQVHNIYVSSKTKGGKTFRENPEVTKANEILLIEKAARILTNQDKARGMHVTSGSEHARVEKANMAESGYFRSQKKAFKADRVYEALSELRFGSLPSLVTNETRFQHLKLCGLYVEEYNVSRLSGSWNSHLYHPYSYLYELPRHYTECRTELWLNNTDMRGSVFLSFQVKSILGNTMENNARVCAKYCCNELRCRAWTLRVQMASTRNCDKGSYCCWLKSAVPSPIPGVSNATSGIIKREHTKAPPTGMRSAVPLGGLGTGSFELRADGTFHEWTIENQSPGGSAKLNQGALDMAVLGVRVDGKDESKAALLRTTPPHGYPGVKSLRYSGSYPVTKISVDDAITEHVTMDVYAHPAFHPRDPYKSAVPAVAFTLALVNKHKTDTFRASFMLSLPLGYQEDTIRVGGNYGEVVFSRNIGPADCAKACERMPKCMAWTTNGPSSCLLKDKMPLHAWAHGIVSGVKGRWSVDQKRSMLTLERPGFFPQSGSTTLHPVRDSEKDVSFGVSNDFDAIWKNFTKLGEAGPPNTSHFGLHGASTISTTLTPGQSTTLTIIMSWYYPHRDQAKVRIGNFYNNFLKSSRGAASIMRKDLLLSINNIRDWQSPVLSVRTPPMKDGATSSKKVNRLPEWLQDMLLNSASFWRSAFWTEDGRFRQWEAFDCNDVDAIHNDVHRILPYMLFYPETVRHLLNSWAANQYSNGRMQEALTEGCLGSTGKLDYAGGRVMSDSSALFVVEVYHYFKWTGDSALLRRLWPNVKRAVTWLIGESTKGTGLPFRKVSTYDLVGIDKYDHVMYEAGVFLLALRAAQHLAVHLKDKPFNATTTHALIRATQLVDVTLWNEERQFYRAWWDSEYGASDWIMSDSLYGQVWANTLGLGELLPEEKMKVHLQNEIKYNDSPYGLRVISIGEPAMSLEDTAYVLTHRVPGCSSLENITKHNSIWMGADADWSSLMISLGADPHLSLKQAKKSLDHWRSELHDQWNIHGLISSDGYGQDGLPWATSHYNSHLVIWHLPLAISGQQYSAPDKTLTFKPKFDIPFELPFFTPTASGVIAGSYKRSGQEFEEMFTFRVTSGFINLKRLAILDSYYGNGEIRLKKDSLVTWSRPKENVASILREL